MTPLRRAPPRAQPERLPARRAAASPPLCSAAQRPCASRPRPPPPPCAGAAAGCAPAPPVPPSNARQSLADMGTAKSMPRHAPQARQRSPSSALALLRAHPARRRARRWYGLSPAVRNAQVSTRFLKPSAQRRASSASSMFERASAKRAISWLCSPRSSSSSSSCGHEHALTRRVSKRCVRRALCSRVRGTRAPSRCIARASAAWRRL